MFVQFDGPPWMANLVRLDRPAARHDHVGKCVHVSRSVIMIGETLAASLLSLNTGPCFLRPLDISYSSSSLTQPLPLAQK